MKWTSTDFLTHLDSSSFNWWRKVFKYDEFPEMWNVDPLFINLKSKGNTIRQEQPKQEFKVVETFVTKQAM